MLRPSDITNASLVGKADEEQNNDSSQIFTILNLHKIALGGETKYLERKNSLIFEGICCLRIL